MLKKSRPVEGWVDEKTIALYQAQAGLPIHNFWPVNGELKEGYETVYREYVTGQDPDGKPTKDFPSHIDRNFEDPEEWESHAVLPSLSPYRNLGSRSQSDRNFFELLAHGVIQQIPLPSIHGQDDEGAAATMIEAVKDVLGLHSAGAMRFANSWRGVLDQAGKKSGSCWVLLADFRTGDSAVPAILRDELPAFALALGMELHDAFTAYRDGFLRGNKVHVNHVHALRDEKRDAELEKEDPRAFQKILGGWDEQMKEMQSKLVYEDEQGFRVSEKLRFSNEAVAHFKELYKLYNVQQ
jgi:hypothetical protein